MRVRCADAPPRAGGTQDELHQYYSKFTGNLTGEPPGEGELPTFLPGTSLGFEQAGATADTTWPYVL